MLSLSSNFPSHFSPPPSSQHSSLFHRAEASPKSHKFWQMILLLIACVCVHTRYPLSRFCPFYRIYSFFSWLYFVWCSTPQPSTTLHAIAFFCHTTTLSSYRVCTLWTLDLVWVFLGLAFVSFVLFFFLVIVLRLWKEGIHSSKNWDQFILEATLNKIIE